MTFHVQLANKLTNSGGVWTYEIVGAIVSDGERVEAVALDVGGDGWVENIRPSLSRWKEGPLALMDFLHEQNGTQTSYSAPVTVKAKGFREAAEKVHARVG